MAEQPLYDDKDLFVQIAGSYEPAFRILFDRYKTKIYFFILRMVKSPHETEELVQDVFLRLWLSRKSLVQVDHPSTYLFVMARNRALDHIQKMAAERNMKSQLSLAKSDDYHVTEKDIDFNASKVLFEEAVRRLPAQQQKVFRLHWEVGLNRHEIAQQLDISPNTAKNHLADALKSIRVYMKEHMGIILLILINSFSGK